MHWYITWLYLSISEQGVGDISFQRGRTKVFDISMRLIITRKLDTNVQHTVFCM